MAVDADVRVLKAEMSAVTTAVERMTAKLDTLVTMQVEVGKMQTELRQHSEALERAFKAIGDNRGQVGKVDSEVHRSLAFIRGALFVGALLLSAGTWYAKDRLNDMKIISTQLTAVDRRVLMVEQYISKHGAVPMGE